MQALALTEKFGTGHCPDANRTQNAIQIKTNDLNLPIADINPGGKLVSNPHKFILAAI